MGCDTLLKDKYLLNPKSFMASTLKDLTELNCSKPTQPDHFETTTNPPPVDTDTNFTPPTHPGHTEVQTNSSQTKKEEKKKQGGRGGDQGKESKQSQLQITQ